MKTILLCVMVVVAMTLCSHSQEILNVRMLHAHNEELQAQAVTGHVAAVVGYDVVTAKMGLATNYYWVNKRWELTDRYISSIMVDTTLQSSASLILKFTPVGVRKLAQSTTHDQKRSMAIFADREFLTVWPITEPITAGEIKIKGMLPDQARMLKERFDKRQTEQSAASLPPAPQTGPSEDAR